MKPIAAAGVFLLLAMSLRLPGQAPQGGAAPCGIAKEAAKIDVNSATRQELETLPGIGPARAAMIVRIRETSGPFQSVEELRALPRLTDKQFEKLRRCGAAIRPPGRGGAKRPERGER